MLARRKVIALSLEKKKKRAEARFALKSIVPD